MPEKNNPVRVAKILYFALSKPAEAHFIVGIAKNNEYCLLLARRT